MNTQRSYRHKTGNRVLVKPINESEQRALLFYFYKTTEINIIVKRAVAGFLEMCRF